MSAGVLPGELVHITTNPDTEPFWQAARERRLVALRCGACRHFRMPPTPFCPECSSTDKDWVDLSGRAEVFSYTVVHGFPGLPELLLVPVVVELPDAPGARLVSNVVGVAPADVTVGMQLKVDFSPVSDGWLLPVFRPAD